MNKKVNKNRIIGERIGSKPGPLMIVFAQIHGNEPAGYKAVEELFKAIDLEYLKNPNFEFCGRIVALQGNVKAAQAKVRYIKKDLNRSWLPQEIDRIRQTEAIESLDPEDQEIKENLDIIDAYIDLCLPPRVLVLDLHTTTAHGGIFTIPSQNSEARRIALSIHAPVLHGFLDGLKGTTLHYFSQENFEVDMNAVCFEAGQHNSEDAYKHAVSAVIQCFKSIGGFYAKDIEIRHNQLLEERSKGLPLEAKLMYVHPVDPSDNFRMTDAKVYSNFDSISEGEILAYDKNGPIKSPYNGLILMPLYQKQGDDGFFVIQEVTARSKEEQSQGSMASKFS
jgi:succinylglutamate desuccinylase